MKWQCPVCGNNAYSNQGGIYQPAYKYTQIDEQVSSEGTIHIKGENKESIMFRTNSLFMCKGCSVFFNSPTKFNAVNVQKDVHSGD